MANGRRPDEWRLDGQGEALPASVEPEAQWIWRHRLYLYRVKIGAVGGVGISLTRGAQLTDGTWCSGVDAGVLGPAFGLSVEELFAHNRAQTLFVAIRHDPPSHGGTGATSYRFRVGTAVVALTFEEGIPEGRA
jgi:hypothetical protein